MKALITILIPGAMLLGALSPSPALAEPVSADPASAAVSFDDLNLNDPADRSILQRRVRAAAQEVCGTGYSFDLRGRNQARECVALTVQSVALPQPSALASAE
ncbi:UrcA family protein [Parasphingopyxis marina]|uniref:UrcA family protein n=1 Tax=Parasphingopyxis marina TaxID=2761622 RepID=A0A842HVM6_9SPHN|nr:UrcA family protein [Parasphingopyxis marina]MBC2776309.1 UrcA family protein [Parasphingopyxis marina]